MPSESADASIVSDLDVARVEPTEIVWPLRCGAKTIRSPSAALATDVEMSDGLVPIYVAHGGLKTQDFRRLVKASRDKFAEIPDLLPTVKAGTRREALFTAHFPEDMRGVEGAREYLAYEELFELILAARLNRRENEKLKAEAVGFKVEKIREFVGGLPFRLTNAQRLAAWEIFQDMGRGHR